MTVVQYLGDETVATPFSHGNSRIGDMEIQGLVDLEITFIMACSIVVTSYAIALKTFNNAVPWSRP